MMNLGPVQIDRLSDVSDIFAVVVAATQLHDAFYYGSPAVVQALPRGVAKGYGELHAALERLKNPAGLVQAGAAVDGPAT